MKREDGGAKNPETFVGSMLGGSSRVQFACGCASLSWGVMQRIGEVFGDVDYPDGYIVKIVVRPTAQCEAENKTGGVEE